MKYEFTITITIDADDEVSAHMELDDMVLCAYSVDDVQEIGEEVT